MKTQNQMFAEFQKEFDKKRLKEFWWPILFLEAILAMLAMCFLFAMLMPDSNKDNVGSAFSVLIFFAILFLVMGFIVPLFHEKRNKKSEFHVGHIITRLIDERLALLNKKAVVEEQLKAATSKANNGRFWVEYFYNDPKSEARQDKFSGGLSALGYILSTSEEANKQEADLKTQFDTIQKLIDQLGVKRDFYHLYVNERTYWDYLKSFKWLKRIRKEK
jgi:hypothetical protein